VCWRCSGRSSAQDTEIRKDRKTETKSCRKKELRGHGKAIKCKSANTDVVVGGGRKSVQSQNRKSGLTEDLKRVFLEKQKCDNQFKQK
jgi:alkaline phosphatase